MKKLLITLLCIIFCSCNILGPNISSLAQNTNVLVNGMDYFKQEEQNIAQSDTPVPNNASYLATKIETDSSIELRKNNKSFLYCLGVLDQSSMLVSTTDMAINISSYIWYSVKYYCGNIYVADVTANNTSPQDTGIVGVFIYPIGTYIDAKNEMFNIDYTTSHILEILFVDSGGTTCTKIITPINDTFLNYIQDSSINFELSKNNTDVLSKTLIESFSFEYAFKASMYDSEMEPVKLSETSVQAQLRSLPNYGSFANSNASVNLHEYDKYTDFDRYIEEYDSLYKTKVHSLEALGSSFPANDNPIVYIIPRNLFVQPGTYSYIGKEYGFYVRTIQDYESDTISDFIVFDIETEPLYPQRLGETNTPSVTIRPLSSGVTNYLAEWGNIVICDQYAESYLALANIKVSIAINNVYEKNIGDAGYNKYQDYGYAISSYTFEAKGTGLDEFADDVSFDKLTAVLGAISFVGNFYTNKISTIVGIGLALNEQFQLITSLYSAQPTAMDAYELSDGSYLINCSLLGNNNTESMIANYNHLIKGFETEMVNSQSVNGAIIPLLLKTNNDYITVKYNFCQKDSTVNWDALIATNIYLEIYNDYTGKLFSSGIEDFIKRDAVVGGRVDYYMEAPTNSNGGTIQEGVLYGTQFRQDPLGEGESLNENYSPLLGSYQDFYFTPNRTFEYVIETTNRVHEGVDPYLKLYNPSNNLIASNDDGGAADSHSASPRNAKITFTLTGGQTYRIRTMTYGYENGYYEFIIRKNATLSEAVSADNVANSTTVSNDAIWYKFTPAVTNADSQIAYYSFYTTGSVDTYLSLYDESFNQYAFSDDDGPGRNARIDFYLIAGKTYYLKVNTYSMSSGTFDVYANLQRLVQLHPLQYRSDYVYSYKENMPNYFRIAPNTNQSYIIQTFLISGDPYLELYDETMTLIAIDSSSGGGGNCLINCDLQGGKTYYLKVRSWPAGNGIGTLRFDYN